MKKLFTLPVALLMMAASLFAQNPVASFTSSPTCVILGDTVQFTNTGTGNIAYLWNFGDPGSLLKDTNTLTNASHTFSAVGTYTVTLIGTNGTVLDTAHATITVITAKISPAGDTVCRGGTPTPVTLTASGGGTYAWSNGGGAAASATFTPFATTTYTVTVSNGPNCSVTASRTVVVSRIPTPTITPANPTVCAGHSIQLTANPGGGGGVFYYSWSNGNDSATITVSPSANTTYTVTVSGGGACSATATTTVTVANFTPGITPATDTICSGASTTLTATGGGIGSVYSWSTGATTAAITVTPSSLTTYSVSVTEANGCSGIATRTVAVSSGTINAAVTPAHDTICRGGTPTPVTLTASGGGTYAWSNGGGTNATATFNPFATTTYTVTVTNGACSATASGTVVVVTTPVATITPAASTVCSGHSTVITASGGGLGTVYSYAWSNGIDSAAITVAPTVTTTYTVTVSGGGACSATASTVVTVANFTPAVTPATDSICSGVSTTLTATGGGAGSVYVWSNAAVTPAITVSPTTTTTYTVSVTELNGCSGTASTTVVVSANNVVAVVHPVPDTICSGQSSTLTASGGTTYAWSSGQATAIITVRPTTTTTYTVTVSAGSGCSASAITTVYVNPSPTAAITPGTPINVCAGNTTVLTATGGGTYVWSTGSDSSSVTVSPTANTTYSVTVTSANGCTAAATKNITVSPVPTANINPATAVICAGGNITLTATGAGFGGGGYVWNTAAVTATITVTPLTTTTYTVTVTSGAGCSATASRTVAVDTVPVVSIVPAIDTICAGQTTTLIALGGPNYTWSNGSATQAIIITPTASTTYKVTVTNSNNCSASDSVNVVVKSNPVITINPGNTAICVGNSTVLTATGGGSYAWSSGDVTAAITVSPTATTTYDVTVTGANGCSAVDSAIVIANATLQPVITPANPSVCSGGSTTLTVTAGATYAWTDGSTTQSITVSPSATTTYTVTVTNGPGCSATASASVTFYNTPTALISPAVDSVCAGQSATVTASGGTAYAWSNGATSAALTVTPAVTTTYKVTVTGAGGCTAIDSVTIKVNPNPTVTIAPGGPPAAICAGGSIVLTATGAGVTGIFTYAWSNGNDSAAITVAPTATTTYTVTATSAGGCSATANKTVNVNAIPVVTITPATDTICSGQTATLTANAGGGGGIRYTWSTGGGGFGATINVTPTATTTYRVTVTNGGGPGACSATDSVVVVVKTSPTVTITPATVAVCSGQSAILTALGGVSYVWSSGSDSASTVVTPTATTTYTVTGTAANGCSATASRLVTVRPTPTATVNPATSSICIGNPVTLTAFAGGGGGNTYIWSNGGTTAAISVSPTTTTTYTVTVTNGGGCSATASGVVIADSTLVPVITPSNPTICAGSPVTLTVTAGTTYAWSNASNRQTITVTPATSTTYTVTVTNGAGCSGTASVNVTVVPSVTAAIAPATVTLCAGSSTTLTASGGPDFVWSTGSDSASITVTPAGTTTYTVTVTNAAGCSATASRTVTIAPALNVRITPPGVTNICIGGSTTITAAVAGGTATYLWSNGSTTAAITVTPASATTYTVTATNTTGCTATATKAVTVNPIPVAAITPATDTICAGSNTTLTASGGGGGFGAYVWSTGARTTAITVAPTVSTTYNVTVTGTGGCTAVATRTVVVNPKPVATVSPATDTICSGVAVSLTAAGGTSYTWSTGTNTAIIAVAPTSSATYTVTVTGSNGCTASAASSITVNSVSAAIAPAIASICTGQTDTLRATGTGAYAWSTGSTSSSIVVTPATTTTYTLTVTAGNNCSASASATVNVNNTLVPVITPAAVSICIGNATTLVVSHGTSYQWSNGSTTQNILVAPAATTTYNVTVSNGVGCSGTASVVVTVNNLPVATITPATASVCRGSSTILTAGGGISYAWSNNNTTAGITVSPAFNTTYTVTVTNAGGCSATASRLVSVNPPPFARIAPGASNICLGANATLTASGGTGYVWNNNATTAAITVTPTVTTSYSVTVTSAAGCSATASATVTVNTVSATITPATDTICRGTNTILTASGGTAYRWSNGGFAATNTVAPVATTTYTVTVTSPGGCSATASRVVNVIVPAVTITPLTDSLCKGGSATLTANGGSTYAWNVGANTQSITVSPIVTTNYSVTATNNQGCTATATRTVVVKTNPTVSVTPVTDTICGSAHLSITAIGTGAYNWSTNATTQIINVTPTSSTVYTVTLTGSNGCTATANSSVTVKPISASINPAISSLCQGQNETLTASGGGTYLWNNGSTSSTISVSPAATTTYTVVVTGSNGCTASASSVVNVNSTLTPVITPANPSVCPGAAVTLAVTAGTTYSWSSGSTTQSITVSPNSPTSYSVTVSNGVGCSGTASVTVGVNSNPVAVITPLSDTICTGQSATLTAGGGIGYAWSNNATTSIVHLNPLNTTTYTVTVTNASNCSATAGATVTVLSYPSATISPSSDSICAGQSASLTASGGISYTWSNNSTVAGITVSPATTTTYTVTASNGATCSVTAGALVTVSSLPAASISASPGSICSGQSATLTATGGTGYAWSTGDDTSIISASPAATTTYTVTVTNANGCSAMASVSLVVNTPPNVVVTPDTATICAGNSAQLAATGGTGFVWSNSTTTAAITVNPGATTSYVVTVTGGNGCSATATGVVVVNNNPTVFINPPSAAVCQGNSITLVAVGGVNYTWSNSSNNDSITVSPASTSTYSVTATDANHCSATASESVTVNNNPVAAIITSNATICQGGNVNLTATGVGTYAWSDSATSALINVSPTTTTTYTVTVTAFGSGCTATASSTINVDSVAATINPALSAICTGQNKTITAGGGGTYLWSNGNTTNSITVTPVITSTYSVTITATNLCSATLSSTVNVSAFLQPVITPANPAICSGDTVALSVTAGATYHWSTTATTQGISVNPVSNATYTVTVTNNGICSGTASVNVTVHSKPVASITPATSSICVGQSDSLTAGTGTGYTWSDGSTSSGITVSPSASTPYSVTVTNSFNCSASATASITVNNLPVAAITPSNDTICSGTGVSLVASGGTTYAWNNGSTTASVSESPASTSSYFVTVSSAAGCSATASATINVNQTPVAETSPDTAVICAGQTASFTAYDTTGNGNVVFNWSNGATTNIINVSPLNNTTYSVTITANNCSSSTSALLLVNPLPVAAIQPVSGAVCLGQSTTLTASGGTGGYLWSTGETTASISVSPSTITSYSVTATNTSGCSATASATVAVNNLPTASVNPGSVLICSGQNATFTAAGGTSYAWSSNQTTPSITVNPTATTTYTVTASDANGCTASATGTAIVNTPVLPVVTPATSTICSGQTTTLTASGDVSYVWSNTSTTAGITVAPANTATYTVTGTDGNGCTATASGAVTVNASPNAAVNPAVSSLCSGQSTNLTASGGVSYVWSNTSTTATISVGPANTTTFTVTVTGSNNCTATASAVVNVNASLIPVITPASSTICQGSSATLTVTSGVSYQWNNGATTQSITVSPSVGTSYSVTVSNGGVCNGTASATLAVNSNPTVFFTPASTLTVCNGDNVSITAGGGVSYSWSNGASVAAITVHPSGNTGYVVTVTDGNGCSSTGAASVQVNPTFFAQDSASICSGGSYHFGGRTITTAGIYNDTLSTVNGCDSIVSLKLNVTPYILNQYGITVCGGSSFPFGGHNLTQPGVYTDTLTSYQGCDSIIILTLQFGGSLNTTINTSTCAGSGYTFAGHVITNSGTYYDTLTAVGGCDSIVTLNLVVKAVSASSIADSICPGGSFSFNGRNLSDAGTYLDTLTNSVGCDSIVTLILSVKNAPVITWNVSDTICTHNATVVVIPAASPAGGSYTGAGVTGDSLNLANAGTAPYHITYALSGSNGCVSTTTIAFIAESCIVGINELSFEQQVKIYPNPTTGILVVESALFTAEGPQPVIYDLTGKMAEAPFDRETGKFTFSTAKLSAGVYFIHFMEQGVSVNMKFVKID